MEDQSGESDARDRKLETPGVPGAPVFFLLTHRGEAGCTTSSGWLCLCQKKDTREKLRDGVSSANSGIWLGVCETLSDQLMEEGEQESSSGKHQLHLCGSLVALESAPETYGRRSGPGQAGHTFTLSAFGMLMLH